MKLFDKHGTEVKEFAVLKIFHFIGARKKKHYMYKWVRNVNGRLVGMHLDSADEDSHFHLRCIANADGVMADVEIVQQHDDMEAA